MSIIQKSKFVKLAQVIDFDNSDPEDFVNKMDTIAESIRNTSEEDEEEDKKDEDINENTNIKEYVPTASHLF